MHKDVAERQPAEEEITERHGEDKKIKIHFFKLKVCVTMSLSYHSEGTDGRFKAQFRLFVQIIRNLSERNSQTRIQESYVFEQSKRGKVRQP